MKICVHLRSNIELDSSERKASQVNAGHGKRAIACAFFWSGDEHHVYGNCERKKCFVIMSFLPFLSRECDSKYEML